MLHHWHGTLELIRMALAEDEAAYDPTSSLLPDDLASEALMMSKADGVLAGVDVALAVFRELDPFIETERLVADGSSVERGMHVAAIRGRMSSILRAERVALNFAQRMSGVATAVREYVRAVEGLPAQVIDTRKTLPGWRLLDKYAVRMGGGHNHRMSTGDGILIKDNHIAAMATRGETMTGLIQRAKREAAHTIRIEVECDTLDQVREAVEAGAADLDFFRPGPAFARAPAASIDRAVMEKTDAAAVVPLETGWSDVGSWPALHAASAADAAGNALAGDVVAVDTSDSLVRAESRLVATVGVDRLIVVETADAVLVAAWDAAQRVREAVARIEASSRPEHRVHRRVYRPWGSFETVETGDGYRVKRLTIRPGARLSLQSHRRRSEHWVVVRGTARVTRGESTLTLSENQSIYIPRGSRHRLGNPGETPLEVIEVQVGEYLGEDDIERFDDDFGRDRGGASVP